jgi:hypothetical protein
MMAQKITIGRMLWVSVIARAPMAYANRPNT